MNWKDCYSESSVPVLFAVPEHSKLPGDWSLTVTTDISFNIYSLKKLTLQSPIPRWSKSSPQYQNLSLQNDMSGTLGITPWSCTIFREHQVCGNEYEQPGSRGSQHPLFPFIVTYVKTRKMTQNNKKKFFI